MKIKCNLSCRKKNKIFYCVIILISFVFLTYSNIYKASFNFDDYESITDNPFIKISQINFDKLYKAAFKSYAHRRPLPNLSFALNYYVGGYQVEGYHLVNIVIHIITGLLLFAFIKLTLDISQEGGGGSSGGKPFDSSLVAFSAALLWLVHPLHTQSVTYIIQRMTSMAALFYLGAMVMYIMGRRSDGRRYLWYTGASVSGLCAIGSKEITVTLPIFIFLYEWYFFQNLDWGWIRRKALPLAGIGLFLVVMVLVYTKSNPINWLLSNYRSRDFTIVQRVMTEWRVVLLYITLLFYPNPARLNLDYDFPLSYSLVNPVSTLFSFMFIVGLIILAVSLAKRERLMSFCILWFLGNLVIESSVIPLELVFEHRTYLPSMMVVLLMVMLAARFIPLRVISITLLYGIVLLFSYWTYERNAVWADELTLMQDCVKKSPNNARVNYNLGRAYSNKRLYDDAIPKYMKAISIDPDFNLAYNNLGIAYAEKGLWEKAIQNFQMAISINSNYDQPYFNLGKLYAEHNIYDKSEAYLLKAVSINPFYFDAIYLLGNVFYLQHNYKNAVKYYEEALDINPISSDTYQNMGLALFALNRTDEAINKYLKGLEINPHSASLHNNLGIALYTIGKTEQAIRQLKEAIQIDPNYQDAIRNIKFIIDRQNK